MSEIERAGMTSVDRSRPPGPGPLRPFHFPPIEGLQLDNGVPVLVATTEGFPVVSVSVLLQAGGLYEEPTRAGLASLTGSLLESGAGDRSGAEIAERLEALGIQHGIGTSWDVTHLDVTGIRSRIEPAAAILADLVRAPHFPEAEVDRLRAEQLASILQRRADPRGLAGEMAARFIFSDLTPFARPLGGTPGTLTALDRDAVVAYHAAHFSPSVAAIVVAGDMDPGAAQALAAEHFGDWTGPAVVPEQLPVEPRTRRLQLVVVDRPGSVQSEIRVGHLGLPRNTPDYFPVLVMNAILGGAFSSRLNLNLRERHGFTYGVSSAFVMRRRPGPFVVSTAVQSEVTAPALREILNEIRAMRESAVTPGELQDARTYLAGVFPLSLQTTNGVASRLAELLVYDLPLDYFEGYRDRILEVGAEQVLAAARTHLRPDELAVVIVGDAATIVAPLEELALAPVTVVPPPAGA